MMVRMSMELVNLCTLKTCHASFFYCMYRMCKIIDKIFLREANFYPKIEILLSNDFNYKSLDYLLKLNS